MIGEKSSLGINNSRSNSFIEKLKKIYTFEETRIECSGGWCFKQIYLSSTITEKTSLVSNRL